MPNGRDKDYYVGGWHGKDWREHHTRKECPIGEEILEGDILQGTGGLPKCQTCINLEKEMGKESGPANPSRGEPGHWPTPGEWLT